MAAAENLAGFAGGFVAGLIVARLLIWSERRAAHAPKEPPMRHAKLADTTVRAVAILLASVLLFGSGIYVGFRVLQEEYSCVNDYANDLADSLAPRQRATLLLQERQAEVFKATARLIAGKAKSGRLAAALDHYEDARKDLAAEQAANPYPEPPREVCR